MTDRGRGLGDLLRAVAGPSGSAASRRLRVWTGLGVLFLFAYRALLLGSVDLPGRYELESWFFEPEERATLLVLGMSGWLLWRRRRRFLSLPDRRADVATGGLLALALAAFVWAHLTRSPDLLLPSLVASGLALAAATKGGPGCRVLMLPALLVLFPVLLPLPVRDEIVWQLQNATAQLATTAMRGVGYEVTLNGVTIRGPEHTFVVIESCSGLRGIEILTLVAVLVRELFIASGRRQWLLLLLAPGLGFALNVVRVFLVATLAMAGPEVPPAWLRDHAAQGVLVLTLGTGLLYALGLWMAGGASRAADADAGVLGSPPVAWPTKAAGAWLLVLALLSAVLPPFAGEASGPPGLSMPEKKGGWIAEAWPPGGPFLGALPEQQTLYRRYGFQHPQRGKQIVDLFVVVDVAGDEATRRLFSSKMEMPHADWSVDAVEPARLWTLGLDGQLVSSSRDDQRGLSYVWRLRDEGLWMETVRSVLGLQYSPLRRERPRVIVRIWTPLIFAGPLARDFAKQTLDRFVVDFRSELEGL